MQHQVAVIASVRAVASIPPQIAMMASQYEASAREIVVFSYAEGIDYQQIATLTHAATDQVTSTVRNAVARQLAQVVHNAALPLGGVAADADPMGLYESDHVLGMTAQIGEFQVSYLPIYANPIDFAATSADADADADAAPSFVDATVGQDSEAAA
jgi:hypothetical protein